MLDKLTKEHTESLLKENKVVDDSAASCKEAIEKAEKLITDTQTFMKNFQTSYEKNTSNANKVISNLWISIRTEKEALAKIHTYLQTRNTEFQPAISNKIEKLHAILAVESKIMDELAAKQTRVRVFLSNSLKPTTKSMSLYPNKLLWKAVFRMLMLCSPT